MQEFVGGTKRSSCCNFTAIFDNILFFFHELFFNRVILLIGGGYGENCIFASIITFGYCFGDINRFPMISFIIEKLTCFLGNLLKICFFLLIAKIAKWRPTVYSQAKLGWLRLPSPPAARPAMALL